jgi:tRNA (adenine37-N6)-methyltransferase
MVQQPLAYNRIARGGCGDRASTGRNGEDATLDEVRYTPIGVIRSPFAETAGMPIQAAAAEGIRGSVELYPGYREGLRDVEGFSHLILLYHLHLIEGRGLSGLTVKPFMDNEPRGVFATRSPRRPNPIGLSVVRLVGIRGHALSVEDVDVVDGTPLLDIKPYVPAFDDREGARIGWFAGKIGRIRGARADDRFC